MVKKIGNYTLKTKVKSGQGQFHTGIYHNNKKVGYLTYDSEPGDHGYHSIGSAYVHPGHRGKGLYQQVVNHAKEHVQNLGSKGLISLGEQREPVATGAWKKIKGAQQKGDDFYLKKELHFQNLKKGVMRRLHRFSPQSLKPEEREDIDQWQSSGSQIFRGDIPKLEGPARHRALHQLHGKTSVRKNPETGEREFLLHRGGSQEEYRSAAGDTHISHDTSSSWTPDKHQAKSFAIDYGSKPGYVRAPVMSAWIKESDIHHVPKQFGDPKRPSLKRNYGKNRFAFEHEIIVQPHKSQKAQTTDIPFDQQDLEYRASRQQIQPRNIDDVINIKQSYRPARLRGKKAQEYITEPTGKYSYSRLQERQKKLGKLAAAEILNNDLKKTYFDGLQKGVMRRLHGKFDPRQTPGEDIADLAVWQQSSGGMELDTDEHQEFRENVPRLEGPARHRALHRLHQATHSRKNPETGEREFLLYRGGSAEEHSGAVGEHHIKHSDRTSWTPHFNVAHDFSRWAAGDSDPAPVMSAWIKESDIHHIPKQLGNVNQPTMQHDKYVTESLYGPQGDEPARIIKPKKGANEYNQESEVIVQPHISRRAKKKEVPYEQEPNYVKQAPARNIDQLVNIKGKNKWHTPVSLGEQYKTGVASYFRRRLKPRQTQMQGLGTMPKPDYTKLAASEELDYDIKKCYFNLLRKKYEPKRGDIVRLHHGTVDYETGKPKLSDKKYVVHGQSKRGYKPSHWVVPEGEKDSSKGFYHRSDRIHPAEDTKKSELLKKEGVKKGYVYVACDGDSAGNQVERAAARNDVSAIKDISNKIDKGGNYLAEEAEKLGGEVVVHGGDDVGFLLPEDKIDQLDKMRKKYKEITGFTVTIGYSPNISSAVQALLFGKLTGKNKVVKYHDAVKDKLKELYSDKTQEEKIKDSGVLEGVI